MSGYGRAAKAQLIGTSGNLVNITTGGAIKNDPAYRRFIPLGLIRLNATTPIRLPTITCSVVMIRNPEGNATVWVGGSEQAYYANIGVTQPIYETEMIPFEVTNADELSLIAEAINTDVYVAVFTNDDVTTEVSDPGPPDITPPTVVSTFPANGATNIEWNTSIAITFSEAILSNTVDNTSISISPAVTYESSLDSVDPTKANLIPASNLAASTLYTVTIATTIMDLAENAMVAPPYTFSFTTKAAPPPPDTTPPTVISTTPTNNALNVSPSIAPTISFSEDLLDSSVTTTTIKVFKDTDNTAIPVSNIAHSSDGKTITLTLTGVTYSTKYRIEVTGGVGGVADVAGNVLASNYTSYFTTISATSSVFYTLSPDTFLDMDNTITECLEVCANSSSKMYGKIPRSYQFTVGKNNSATGTLSVVILDASNNVVHTFPETKAANTVDVHQGTYTLNSPANTVAMDVNYKIGLKYVGADSSNYIEFHYDAGSTYDGANSIMRIKQNGVYVDKSGDDCGVVISGV